MKCFLKLVALHLVLIHFGIHSCFKALISPVSAGRINPNHNLWSIEMDPTHKIIIPKRPKIRISMINPILSQPQNDTLT
jgi:hypothetical protein